MRREYLKWFSPNLRIDMEMLVFGHSGMPVVVYPTRQGRFFDYENWGLIRALRTPIDEGRLALYCVDSLDSQSLYCTCRSPQARVARLVEYERYILDEVLALVRSERGDRPVASHGCSLGAFHAVNIALRHPDRFQRVVALSGRYDLTTQTGPFRALFDGYYSDDVYYQTPPHFVRNIADPELLRQLRRLDVTLAVGESDVFRSSTGELGAVLMAKEVPTRLDVWNGEAHRARDWREMVRRYF